MSNGQALQIVTYAVPTLLEVIDIYLNASESGYYNGSYAENGIYVNCQMVPDNVENFEYFFMGFMAVFVILLSFIARRVSFKRHLCFGRPGLVLAMNMLNNHDNVVEYTLAFLSLSENIYYFIFGLKSEFGNIIPVAKFFLKLFILIGFSVITYPLFAAIYGRHLLGYVFGIIFLVFYISHGIYINYSTSRCLLGNKIIPMIFIAVISMSINLVLVVVFIWRIIQHVRINGCKMMEIPKFQRKYFDYDSNYVKGCLENKELDDQPANKSGFVEVLKRKYTQMKSVEDIKLNIRDFIARNMSAFLIPPRLMIGIWVGLYYAYRIFIDQIQQFTPTAWNVINEINKRYPTTGTNISGAFQIAFGNYTTFTPIQIQNSYRYLCFFYIQLFINCLLFAIAIGLLNSIIQSFLILKSYRKCFQKIKKTGSSFVINPNKVPKPYELILGFIRFSGYQAAYILWGILILSAFLFVILFGFIGFVFMPLFYVDNSWPRQVLINYGPVLLVTLVFNILQTILVKYVFVKEKGMLLEINNRRAFMIYTHCFFFLNAVMGIFNSIQRVLIWLFSGVVCFSRIDFSSLPDYLNTFDSGYMCYVGFVFTEQHHHNPILKCFVSNLLRDYRNNSKCNDYAQFLIAKQCRNKWHVAYTLINNNSLLSERKRLLKIKNHIN